MNHARITVFSQQLFANLHLLSTKCGCRPLPVVKADAYGLGLPAILPIIQTRNDIDCLCVASLNEGIALRDAGWKKEVLLLGPVSAHLYAEAKKQTLVPLCGSIDQIEQWLALTGTAPHHCGVLFDTGMNRRGVPSHETDRAVDLLSRWTGPLDLGTHHACAELEGHMALEQMARWNQIQIKLPRGRNHSANSAAAARGLTGTSDSHFRPGLGMYGVEPVPEQPLGLEPIFSLTAGIAEIRDLSAGQGVSYGHEFIANRPMRIAVLPLGYADGVPVSGASQIQPTLGNKSVKIVGRVTMDMLMIDITDLPESQLVHEVIIMGAGGPSVLEWAVASNRNPYEILTGLGSRPVRMVV